MPDRSSSSQQDASRESASGRSARRWRITWIATVVLCIAAFTPLVIPAGTYEPMVAGVPYTLWVGILVTVALVFLTYAATQLYPPHREEPHREKPPRGP